MTAHTPPQFSPAQVLDAARRAETDGRQDLAIQFYRHLVEHYPQSPQAAAARQALSHYARQHGQDAGQVGGQPDAAAMASRLRPPDPGASELSPPAQYQFGPELPPDTPRGDPQTGPAPNRRISIAPMGADKPRHAFRPPRPFAGYRLGRFLSRLTSWLGGLTALAGLAVLPLVVAGPVLIGRSGPGRDILELVQAGGGPNLALGLVGSGLAMVLAGQLIRALFDLASAARDLAAVTRARAEHEGSDDRAGRPASAARR